MPLDEGGSLLGWISVIVVLRPHFVGLDMIAK